MSPDRNPPDHRIEFGEVIYLFGRFCCRALLKRLTWPTSILLLVLSIVSVLSLAIPNLRYPWLLSNEEHFLPANTYQNPCSDRATDDIPIKANLIRSTKPTTLVVYNLYDHVGAHENFGFFLKHALHSRPDTHFLIVLSTQPCVPIPSIPNLGIVVYDASCYGFGAIFDATVSRNLEKAYERYLVLGSWVRGPFMPSWSDECWTDAFMRPFNASEVFLSGTTHSCYDRDGKLSPRLHSTAWALKMPSFEPILQKFSCKAPGNTPNNKALELSSVLSAHIRGWNVASLDPGWHNFSSSDSCGSNWNFKPHPYETIFINNRLSDYVQYAPSQHSDFTVVRHTEFATKAADLREYTSMEVCK